MSNHKSYCFYPSEPCCCHVENENERRTIHKSWCGYPSEPCSCDLEGAEKGEHD